MAPIIFLLTLLLPITCVSAQVDVHTLDVHTVQCNHTTPACECRQSADVCVFSLQIELLHAFTRYFIDPQYGERVNIARVYYFGDDGQLYGHTGPQHPFCLNATEDDVSQCTATQTFDASTFKPFIGVNGQVPGPNLIVWENQTVVVNVSNELQMETISIHWHGMYQYNTYFMDGVHHITQCAIDPQKSFRYIFKARPSGTHWYHSHTGVQRSDGLFGALTVRELPAKESQIRAALSQALRQYRDMPAEHTLVISDWFRDDAMEAYSLLESNSWFYEQSGLEPPGADTHAEEFTIGPDGKEAGNYPFWSALINGKGKHPGNEFPYLESRLSVFSVDPGQVYRFRLIGSINNYAFRFSIDEHQLWVVGTDGHWVEPLPADYIALQSGERFDFLLITKPNPTKNNFWMRAEALEIDMPEGTNPATDPPYRLMLDRAAESILHYNRPGASLPTSADYVSIKENSVPVNSTCSSSRPCKMINCPWNIHRAYNWECTYVDSFKLLLPSPEYILPKATPDHVHFFQFGTEGVGALSSVDGRRCLFPSVPPKLTVDDQEFQEIFDREYCKNLDDSNLCINVRTTVSNPACQCVYMKNLEYRKSYRFVLTVAGPHGTFSHPVHMHGHSFFVVKIGLPPINSRTGFVNCFSEDIECDRDYPAEYGKCGYVTNPREGDYACPITKWATGKEYTYPSATTNGKVPTPTSSGKIDPRTPRKDTIMVPAGGYVIIDVVTDNPGVWFMHCHVENHAVEGMGVVLNEAQPNQNPSPPDMRQCGNFEPTLAEFYDWLQFDPDNPATGSPPTAPLANPTTCAAAGFTSGCCSESGNKCYISAGKCWCDASCHRFGNCCPDISSIGCAKCKSVVPVATSSNTQLLVIFVLQFLSIPTILVSVTLK